MTLTDTQLVTLSAASQHEDGLLTRPPRLRGNAAEIFRKKLVARRFAEEARVTVEAPHWREDGEGARLGLRITPAGLAAIGVERAGDEQLPSGPEPTTPTPGASPASRPGSKRAEVLALLSRDEGATLADLIAATGWLPHTTRAALTGFRQKGHAITRDTDPGGTSRYRLANR